MTNVLSRLNESCHFYQLKKQGALSPKEIFATFEVAFDIEPKSSKQIKDNRRTQRGKGKVNKIKANGSRGNTDFFANIATNAKGRAF